MADLPLLSPGARGASLLIQIYLLITAVTVHTLAYLCLVTKRQKFASKTDQYSDEEKPERTQQ